MNPSLHNFLNQNPSKWSTITNQEIINEIFFDLIRWINDRQLLFKDDIHNFKILFSHFLLNKDKDKYKNKDKNKDYYEEDYFHMLYCDEVIDLFLHMKEITKSHGSFLLHDKEDTADDLLYFIFNNTVNQEFIEEDGGTEAENHEYE